MPYVLAWNRAAIEDKMARLAAYLGLPKRSFAGVLDWVLELREQIGIPNTLADLGVRMRARGGVRAAGVRRSLDGRQPAGR